jgi:hypothetical protein
MIRTVIAGRKAQIDDLVWTCDDDVLLGLIKAHMLRFRTGPWDPYPDLYAVQHVIAKLGGRIVKADPAPHYVKGRIY